MLIYQQIFYQQIFPFTCGLLVISCLTLTEQTNTHPTLSIRYVANNGQMID